MGDDDGRQACEDTDAGALSRKNRGRGISELKRALLLFGGKEQTVHRNRKKGGGAVKEIRL